MRRPGHHGRLDAGIEPSEVHKRTGLHHAACSAAYLEKPQRTHPHFATLDLNGPVHVADYGGPAGAPTLLCVHGLANSHASWRLLAERLTATHRVLALDLPGHGRSPVAGRPTSVEAYSQVLTAAMETLAAPEVTLVGHSMGAAVAVLTAARSQHAPRGLVLLAPPLPLDRFRSFNGDLLPQIIACLWPELGIRALRRRIERSGVEAYVERGLELTCASPETIAVMGPILIREMNAAYEAGEDPVRCFLETARSLGLLVAGGRRYRTALTQVRVPTHLIHGAQDRVLPPSSLDQIADLQPSWQVDVLPHVGHSPHMEAPFQVAQIITTLSAADEPHIPRQPAQKTGNYDGLRRGEEVRPHQDPRQGSPKRGAAGCPRKTRQ